MPFGEGYRPKPPEELSQQLETAQDTIGKDAEHSLVPESQDKEDILKMSEAEIKEKFARRYEMYLQLLRHQKRQEKTGESNLSPEEIEEMKKWLGVLNSLDEYIKKHHEGEEITLRGKQIDVFDNLRNFLEEGGSEGYVKLPTGVGKTVLFTELIEAMDVKTLILVPTKILVDQTAEKLEEFAPDLDFGKVYSYAKEHGRQVTIITYDSLVSELENKQIKPEDFDCLILDEAHKSLSDKRQEAVGKFEGAIKLGFTATPKFSEKKQVSNLLEKEIHSMTIREAVEAGMLCSVSSIIVRTEADMSNVKVKYNGEYDEKELEKAVNIVSRNKAAVDLYKKVYDGQLAVAYCVSIDHAAAVAKEFNEAGVSAAYISGKTPKKEQKEILERFHKGDIKVLCNADLLIAGFDEPKASICLNLRPTQSRIDAEQRGGRVLRLDKNKPKKLATVVDFLDKNYSPDKPPVLFADVADGAYFYSGRDDERSGGGGRGRNGGEVPVIIDIEGVEVVYDSEEVMKIVGKIVEEREKNKKVEKINSYSALQIAVRAEVKAKGIVVDIRNLNKTYFDLQKEHPEWVKAPHALKDFVSMEDLFGVKKLDYPSLKAAVQAAVKAGEVKVDPKHLGRAYAELQKKHPEWVVVVEQIPGFVGLADLFGVKKLDYPSLKAAVQAAVKAGEVKFDPSHLIRTYTELRKKHPDWLSSPVRLPNFISFPDLFGLVRDYTALKVAIKVAVESGEAVVDPDSLKKTYVELQKKHPEWVKVPHALDGFVSMQDLFDIKK